MLILRIFGAVCALVGAFLFGMWLAWPDLPYNPSGFPIDRKFIAVALNGEPLLLREAPKRATLEVRGRLTFRHRAGGTSLCSAWGLPVTFLPGKRLVWRGTARSFRIAAKVCTPPFDALDDRYLHVLLSVTHWRTQEGNLILSNGTDVLSFQLAPPGLAD
jgi:hypothetical protein